MCMCVHVMKSMCVRYVIEKKKEKWKNEFNSQKVASLSQLFLGLNLNHVKRHIACYPSCISNT